MSETVLGGRYRLEARIGSGGMAEVHRGFDTTLNRTVAVKVLLPQFARDAGFVERFRREAQAAARLNQPNIVGVYDSGADGETNDSAAMIRTIAVSAAPKANSLFVFSRSRTTRNALTDVPPADRTADRRDRSTARPPRPQ